MRYWFKIIIYFFFVAIVTYFFVSYSEAEKILTFLNDQQDNVEDDTLSFLAATVIANSDDGTDVYIKKNPLFEEEYDAPNTSQHVKVSIYALVEFKENQAHSSLIILLRNIELNSNDVKLGRDNYQEMHANILFDKIINVNDYESSSFDETFVNAYDNNTKLLLINADLFNTANGYAQIQRLDITYSLETGENIDFVSLYNEDLTPINSGDSFDASYDRNINILTYENINILGTYGLNDFENNENIYYNPTLLEGLSGYSYYIKYLLIELAFLIPLTYFLFFHKKVIKIFRYNKELKVDEYKLRQAALIKKYKEQENSEEKKT